jgi:ATP-dependent DNA helicase RecG
VANRVNRTIEKNPVNEESSVEKFGVKDKGSEKKFGDFPKSSERRFGEAVDKPKNIGKTAQIIIDFVISDPSISADAMAYKIGISSRAVEKQIAKLRSMGILSREGADFGGYWRIVINPQTEQ